MTVTPPTMFMNKLGRPQTASRHFPVYRNFAVTCEQRKQWANNAIDTDTCETSRKLTCATSVTHRIAIYKYLNSRALKFGMSPKEGH